MFLRVRGPPGAPRTAVAVSIQTRPVNPVARRRGSLRLVSSDFKYVFKLHPGASRYGPAATLCHADWA